MKDNLVVDNSRKFAVRMVKLFKYLTEEKREFVMSRQLLRSGTSIGANISEAVYAQSRSDFVNKLSIALKEAAETRYWLELLNETGYLYPKLFDSLHKDCTELIKLLTKILNSTKTNN